MDLYQLTMVAGYLREGKQDEPAVFDLGFRRNPFDGGYAVFAGLDPGLEYLENLQFGPEELRYLEGLGLFDDQMLEWLRDFRFRGKVTAVSEGEIVFAHEPVVTIEGGLAEAQLVETALLNLLNYQTLVATKAARIVLEAGVNAVVEFGARRAPGPDGALGASRAARIGGARATSNLSAGQAFGLPVAGTQAHSWVMAFADELTAFRSYAAAFPDSCILLVDTYDTLRSGLPHAIEVAIELRDRGHELRGIRLDSGDLAYLSREARRMLDDAGFPEVKILASNDLDEHIVASIRKEGGRIDVFGVGTRLVTGAGESGGALGGVYKLVELSSRPRIKVSADRDKCSIPGRKKLWRLSQTDNERHFELDVITAAGAAPESGHRVYDPVNPGRWTTIDAGLLVEDIRSLVMEDGKRLHAAKPLDEIAAYAQAQLARLPDGVHRLLNPHVYRVSLSAELHALREALLEAAAAALPAAANGAGR
jgi:nicotinate phosphoribosyltransferase